MLRIVILSVQLLERRLVPLVEEEELALRQHLADHLVKQGAPQSSGG